MTSAQVEHFAEAAAHEHELNERQRRVLDLLVEGKTNGEVADALGITLDGAKWNVSEILGKLGLATREEAADYWRWRKRHGRGALRAIRGLAGPAALKWAAGGVAAAVTAAIAVGFLAASDDKPAAPGEFYLEARIEVVDRSRTIGTNIAGAAPAADDAETTVSTLRWWSKDRDHARWEVHRQTDGGPTIVTTIVVDGTWQWVYSSATNSYSKSALPDLPDGVEIRPLALSLFVGPIGAVSKQAFLEELRDPESFNFVREAGTATVLGRETTIIEFGPASRSSSQGSAPLGGPTPAAATETSSGVVRVWLDEERVVAMRYVVEGSTADVRAEVVQLDWNTPVPARQLVFTPPPGATFVQAETGRIPASSHFGGRMTEAGTLWYTTPPGFFKVAYAPDTMRAGDYETEFDANDRPAAITIRFTGYGSEMTVAQMRARPTPVVSDRPPDLVTVVGTEAQIWEDLGDADSAPQVQLSTRRDGINITITAHGLPPEEVIAVAEGLELVR